MNPFPKNLGAVLAGYKKILVPEMNSGQLVNLVRAKYLVPAEGFNKVQGLPFTTAELKNKIKELF
jgi:2-oxoglutarate ferredoxin oxidoreductase subunit alpha